MNKLSIHGITEITIEREVIKKIPNEQADLYMNPDEFTVINVTAKDRKGTRTRLTCFVEPDFNPLDDMVIATKFDVEVSHVE